ncbi:putative F-box domain-containing protein [Helianthus debilis subsp. tardiflorus]
METLEEAKISIPTETMEDIFSRLPIKSILRFRSLSKPWLLRLSSPSFTKLHSTRANRTFLFISAHDRSARKQHLLSASHDGGPVTHLITLDDLSCIIEAQHLNGLVYLTCVKRQTQACTFVVNPSTRKIFNVPDPSSDVKDLYYPRIRYLFGFDESTNEHKILMIRDLSQPSREIMIFSMSTYSWRKIHAQPPVGFSWDRLRFNTYQNVCVNSVVHLMLTESESFDILAFDLRTEKFSIITTPQGVMPEIYHVALQDDPYIIKVNGCIGVVCYDSVEETNQMHIWILQDYENRVWVKETITFLEPWIKLKYPLPFPTDSVNMDEIILSSIKFSDNMIRAGVYNKKNRCFKSLQFASGHQFSLSGTMQVDHIRCYVESMVPL